MFDIRYHLVSLVAVFLALALGVLLGTLVAGRGTLAERQSSLIQGIQDDISKVQGENKGLQDELNQERQQLDALFGALIRDQLVGRRIVVVTTVDLRSETRKLLTDLIGGAGGEAVFLDIASDFAKRVGKRRKQLEPFLDPNLPAESIRNAVVRRIAGEIAAPVPAPEFIRKVSEEKLARASDPNLSASFVVFYAGGEEERLIELIQVPLIEDLEELGVSVAGVEVSTTAASHISIYQKAGISTVDNIDLPSGRVALVHVIGGKFGNYGTRPSASSLLPALAE